MPLTRLLPWIALLVASALPVLAAPLPRLKVSENHHFLVTDAGKPFFWLGDTDWELFHRLNREEADRLLADRAGKGFTILQSVAIAELEGHTDPNAYGHLPLVDLDPTRPALVDGPANDYWDHVDYIVNKANSLGLYIGFLPTWGRFWHDTNNGRKPLFTVANAEVYGEWLDFNMRQNGHTAEFTGRYDNTRKDYDRTPVKPVVDGEPIYEDHPVSFDAKKFGHSLAADVRRPLYWDLFGGAFGHTYGHHSVWQMWSPGKNPINNPLLTWSDAIHQPGAGQMQHARHLLESRPFLTRIPDDSIVVVDRVPTAVPGAGRYRFSATRDSEGSYAMIYVPVGRPFKVRMEAITGDQVKAWWFNPRDGTATAIGRFARGGEKEFVSPDPGETIDWVLVLDDAGKNYPAPGKPQ